MESRVLTSFAVYLSIESHVDLHPEENIRFSKFVRFTTVEPMEKLKIFYRNY